MSPGWSATTSSGAGRSAPAAGGDDGFLPRLLLVEDDRGVRELATEYLGQEGYRVAAVPDGEEGLRRLTEERFDAVILDLNLPERHGFEVLEAARAAGIETPVVITTAEEGAEPVIRALRAGADDYLRKPVDPDALLRTIEKLVLSRRRSGLTAAGATGERLLLERALLEGWELARLEREYLLLVLGATGGNRTRTAEILGIARRTVYRKLKVYGKTRK